MTPDEQEALEESLRSFRPEEPPPGLKARVLEASQRPLDQGHPLALAVAVLIILVSVVINMTASVSAERPALVKTAEPEPEPESLPADEYDPKARFDLAIRPTDPVGTRQRVLIELAKSRCEG